MNDKFVGNGNFLWKNAEYKLIVVCGKGIIMFNRLLWKVMNSKEKRRWQIAETQIEKWGRY